MARTRETIGEVVLKGALNANGVLVTQRDQNLLVTACAGATGIMPDQKPGYAMGAEFTDTTTGYRYQNTGTTALCTFSLTATVTSPIVYVSATTISAHVGGGQASATALAAEYNNVTTVTSNYDSVKLPTAATGLKITVKNSGASVLSVFPFASDSINGLSANASIDIPVKGQVTFNAISTVIWKTQEAIAIPDDASLVLGTTTATAETKVTATFDETTTGIGLFNQGSTTYPMVLNTNPGAAVAAHTVNVLHSAGAGNCDDLQGIYSKVAISGSGDSGLTAVGMAPRAYVLAGAAQEVYGCQSWAKHVGTGSMLAMSAVSAALQLNDAEAFTSTNSINAGHFHVSTVSGAANGTITSSNFDGVMIEIYPNVTGLGSMLHLARDGAGTVTNAIKITGGATVTNVLSIDSTTGCVVFHDTPGADANYDLIVSIGGNPYAIRLTAVGT
jgi:hypothetical protein